jgi:hypothetical protein
LKEETEKEKGHKERKRKVIKLLNTKLTETVSLSTVSIFAVLPPSRGRECCRYWSINVDTGGMGLPRPDIKVDISQDMVLGEGTVLSPGNFSTLKRKRLSENRELFQESVQPCIVQLSMFQLCILSCVSHFKNFTV